MHFALSKNSLLITPLCFDVPAATDGPTFFSLSSTVSGGSEWVCLVGLPYLLKLPGSDGVREARRGASRHFSMNEVDAMITYPELRLCIDMVMDAGCSQPHGGSSGSAPPCNGHYATCIDCRSGPDTHCGEWRTTALVVVVGCVHSLRG